MNFTDRARGFQIGIIVVLESAEALKSYLEHPIHRKFSDDVLGPLKEDIMVLDIAV